tara:strand:+ start:223 stop:516 length:294 start_codon:yes stop_codon:yes gene_type:complete
MNEMQLLTTTMIMKYCNVLDIVLDTGWSCITLKCDATETKDFVEIDIWLDGKPSLQEPAGHKGEVCSVYYLHNHNLIAKLIYDDWESIKPATSRSMK